MTKNRDLSRSRSTSDSSPTHWFFLDGENQHGPFSAEELRGYFDIGALAKQTLLWHSGMPEWLPVDQVSEFAKYSDSLPSIPTSATPRSIDWSSDLDIVAEPGALNAQIAFPADENYPQKSASQSAKKPAPSVSEKTVPQTPQTTAEDFPTYESVLRFATGGSFFDENANTQSSVAIPNASQDKWKKFTEQQIPPTNYVAFQKQEPFGLSRKSFIAMGLFGGATLIIAGIFALRVGSEPSLFSKVSRESNYELKSALHSSYKNDGAKVAVGLSIADVYAPFFIIGTNIPNGQVLEVAIDGVPETLVDRFKVSVHTTVTVKDGVAQTPVFRQEQGIPYPSGSYRVRVNCPQCETLSEAASAPLAEKIFPVNTKNLNYDESLSSYHKKLRAQAKDELTELKQISETLESQLNETDSAFHQISAKKNFKAAKHEWNEFHDHWVTLQRQLDTLSARWTPAALDGGYFYASLYSTLKKSGDATTALHDEQNKFMNETKTAVPARSAAFLATAQKARSWIEGLRTKIRQTDETLPNANDMPPTLE